MAKNIAFRIEDARGGLSFARLSATLLIGFNDDNNAFQPLLAVKDVMLRDGSKGPWVSFPSKPRMKNKEHQTDPATGKALYDNLVDLPFVDGAGKDGGRGIPEAAWKFKDHITELMLKVEESLKDANAGRGAATKKTPPPAAKRTAPPPAAVATTEDEPASMFGDDGDDDLPF